MDAPGRRMSKTPLALLTPLPTPLPESSSTSILTPATGFGGVFRASLRQPWMWMVSSLRGAGFSQACEPASGTCVADADPPPARTSSETATPSTITIHAEMLLGRACIRTPLPPLRHGGGGTI